MWVLIVPLTALMAKLEVATAEDHNKFYEFQWSMPPELNEFVSGWLANCQNRHDLCLNLKISGGSSRARRAPGPGLNAGGSPQNNASNQTGSQNQNGLGVSNQTSYQPETKTPPGATPGCPNMAQLMECGYHVAEYKSQFLERFYKKMWMECMPPYGNTPMVDVKWLSGTFDDVLTSAVECGWKKAMRQAGNDGKADVYVDAIFKGQTVCEVAEKKDVHELGLEDAKMNKCVEEMSVELGKKENLKPEDYLNRNYIDNNTKDYETLYYMVKTMKLLVRNEADSVILGDIFAHMNVCYQLTAQQLKDADYSFVPPEHQYLVMGTEPVPGNYSAPNSSSIVNTQSTINQAVGTSSASETPTTQPNGRQRREVNRNSKRQKRKVDYRDYDYLKTRKTGHDRSGKETLAPENYVQRKKRVIECAFQIATDKGSSKAEGNINWGRNWERTDKKSNALLNQANWFTMYSASALAAIFA